jgi:soluble lytic murein transglycosylase
MRGRLLCLFSCLLLSSVTLEASAAASLAQQRLFYDEAKRALAKGDSGPYRMYANALADYPLEPYLAYDELTYRLKSASNAEIEKFLAEHGDLPQANWMKLRWLRWLAERGDWKPFVKYYDPKMNFTELDCLNGQHQLISGQTAEGYASAEKLWLVGKSQPDACEPLFSMWANAGQMTETMRWKRLKLAVQARNYSLASHLTQTLPTLGSQGQLMIDVAQKPAMLSQTARFTPASQTMADVVSIGLRRLAKQDPEKAISLLNDYTQRLPFSAEEKVAIAREIGLTLAKSFDDRALPIMTQYDPELRDNTVTEWRARLLLRLGRWSEANQLIRRMPADLASTNRWRYWQARSQQLADPNNQGAALLLYQPVSKERDFYGFMAADQLKTPYQLTNKPLLLDPKLVQKVRNTPGIRRALEFHDRGQIVDGRREWYHVSRLFSRDELVAQARLAYDKQWYFPAIRTISQAQYWDDLDVRFPMAHQNTLVREAKVRGLHSSWVFAITRQESAFMDDARSGVGASGLMQLMPGTAKETARKFSIPFAPQQLLDPDKNVQLGAAYLSQVHGQFNGNRVLASAAYNAGPGRVRQWLKGSNHLAYDVWVETIPFDETRQYVQNVLSYAVIYGFKLNAPQPLVDWHERFFDDQ